MIFDVRSLAFSLKLLSVSENLYPEGQETAIANAVADAFGPGGNLFLFSRAGLVPPYVIADYGDVVYCWASGVHNARQGLAVLVNGSKQLEAVGEWASNPLYVAAGRVVLESLLSRSGGSGKRWVLTGHSYGGALLSVTSILLKAAYPTDDVQLCTFGSPRPGDAAMCRVMRSLKLRRWMNSADPVPRFPPHFNEAPAASIAAGYFVASTWSAYSQPRGGIVVYPDGVLAAKPLPLLDRPIQDVLLLDWISGIGGIQSAEHTLTTYRRNMERVAARQPASAALTTGSVSGDNGGQMSFADFIRLATGAAAAQGNNASSEGGKVSYIPMGSRVSVAKIGTEYAVLWGNGIIAAGKTLAGARAFKRDFNRALRSMQNLDFVNQVALNTALADYLFAASTPGSGFEPILVVT